MSRAAVAQHQSSAQPVAEAPTGILQRTCSCGQHTAGGECDECREKKQGLRRRTRTGEAAGLAVPLRSPRVQPKPVEVRAPNDVFEREADRVAAAVMRIPGSTVGVSTSAGKAVQRTCSKCADEARAAAPDREDEEETHAGPRGSGAPAALASVLDALDGSGRPLSSATRSFFECRMGHDFGSVRVHTGAAADGLARSVDARAFTWRNHIVFGAGEYAEGSWEGRHLLAHELTHTIQQGGATPTAGHGEGVVAPLGSHGVQGLQRFCRDLAAPPAMTCQIGAASPANPGTFVEFGQNSNTLTPASRVTLQSVAAVWHARGGVDVLTVNGFASIEGREEVNCPLSCRRAEAVAAELTAPPNSVPAANVVTVAHGETDEFSASLPPNRRVVITTTGGAAAPTETITSQTVELTPGVRTRTTIGVGEQVNLTHVPGSAAWATTAGTLSAAAGAAVILTAPDTAQAVTVTAGTATIVFVVLAPTSVAMDRQPGTGVKHTLNRADSGIQTRVFLGPDTVNFSSARYRELDVPGVPTAGVYSCNTFSTGHCAGAAGGACPDKALTNTVVAGMGTQSLLGDCAYSGHCGGSPPFVSGSITVSIPYEYRVGAGAFHAFTTVIQLHMLVLDMLFTAKAGATGSTTVPSATVTIPQCP